MCFELRDRVARKVQLEHQLAHFIVEEAGDSLDLQTVCINNANVFEVCVSLSVISAREPFSFLYDDESIITLT